MKKCSRCQQKKSLGEFAFKNRIKGTLQAQCNPCRKQTAKESYRRNREKVVAKAAKRSKEHKKRVREWILEQSFSCNRCGENHPAVLDFHHSDPREKDFNVADGLTYSLKRVKQEISKCEILCSNCHRKHHWQERMNVCSSTG